MGGIVIQRATRKRGDKSTFRFSGEDGEEGRSTFRFRAIHLLPLLTAAPPISDRLAVVGEQVAKTRGSNRTFHLSIIMTYRIIEYLILS